MDQPHASVGKNRRSTTETTDSVVQPDTLKDNISDTAVRHDYCEFDNVRITPKVIEFRDVYESQSDVITIKLQNVGKVPKIVKLRPPNSIAFKLKDWNCGKRLSAGLTMTNDLTFTNHRYHQTSTYMEITVDLQTFEYPIQIIRSVPVIELEPREINFDVVDLGTAAVVRTLEITNSGMASTKYRVDMGTNELDLVVTPKRAHIRIGQTVILHVQFMALNEGTYEAEFWLTFTDCRSVRVRVFATVSMPNLIIFHPHTTGDFTLIDFRPTYFGTWRYEPFIVRNVSSQVCTFVVLAEIDGQLVEDSELENSSAYDMFQMRPKEGRFEAFEGQVVTVSFNPTRKIRKINASKGTNNSDEKGEALDFFIFLRLVRVQCMDVSFLAEERERMLEEAKIQALRAESMFLGRDSGGVEHSPTMRRLSRRNSAPIKRKDSEAFSFATWKAQLMRPATRVTPPVARLCLHGVALEPRLHLRPFVLRFTPLAPGVTETGVIHIKNPGILPVGFRYRKAAFMNVLPAEGRLNPQSSVEVLVEVRTAASGVINTKIAFDILANECLTATIHRLVVVGYVEVDVKINTASRTVPPKAKILMGITPKVTHEVGMFADTVTFDSNVPKPRAAMLCARRNMRPVTHKGEGDKQMVLARNSLCSNVSAISSRAMLFQTKTLGHMGYKSMIRTQADLLDGEMPLPDTYCTELSTVALPAVWSPMYMPRISDDMRGEVSVTSVYYSASAKAKAGSKANELKLQAINKNSKHKMTERLTGQPSRIANIKVKTTTPQTNSEASKSIPVAKIYPSTTKPDTNSSKPYVSLIETVSTSEMVAVQDSKPCLKSSSKISTVASKSFARIKLKTDNRPRFSSEKSIISTIFKPTKSDPSETSTSASGTDLSQISTADLPSTSKAACKRVDPRSIVAFPNDRARTLRSAPNDRNTRTIFTGKQRYVPPVDPRYQYTEKELCTKQQHDRKYVEYMRSTGRNAKAKAQQMVQLPAPLDDYPMTDNEIYFLLRYKAPKKVPFVAEKLLNLAGKSTFSEPPCSAVNVPLTPMELYNVKISPYNINFGKVATSTTAYASQQIENRNPFSVIVNVHSHTPAVTCRNGDQHTLGGLACFSQRLMFNSDTLGRQNGIVEYIISGNHSYEVTVSAEVVPKILFVDPPELCFGDINPDLAFQPQFMTTEVINMLNVCTPFTWIVPEDSCFTVQPSEGEVPPMSRIACTVTYSPDSGMQSFKQLTLQVEPRNCQTLKCIPTPLVPLVSFMAPALIVAPLSINYKKEYVAILSNQSYQDVSFRVRYEEPVPGCVIRPRAGLIRARSCINLNVQIQFTFVGDFCFTIVVDVFNSKPAEMKVCGTVSYPLINIQPKVVRLPRISVDSTSSVPMKVSNDSDVPGHILFDLQEYPEYHLSPDPNPYGDYYDSTNFALQPRQQLNFYLHFNPADVASYGFCLPIVINGMIGPASIDNAKSLKLTTYLPNLRKASVAFMELKPLEVPDLIPVVQVDCTVAGSFLCISTVKFEFDLRPTVPSQTKDWEDFTISNHGNKCVSFVIKFDESAARSPFILERISGVEVVVETAAIFCRLKPKEVVSLRASFLPISTGRYQAELPIYVEGYGFGSVYNYLYMKGHYPSPFLECTSHKQINLPPVPLGSAATATVVLQARYHDSYVSVSADVQRAHDCEYVPSNAVEVNFPVPHPTPDQDVHTIPAHITFRSTSPTSVRAIIKFSTNGGASCVVQLSAVSDNCLLTTHAFVNANCSRLRLCQDACNSSSSSGEDNDEPDDDDDDKDSTKPRRSQFFKVDLMERNRVTMQSSNTSLLASISSHTSFTVTSQLTLPEEQIEQYPRFPVDDNDSPYAQHMHLTLRAVETWLYEQGFHCDFAPVLPNSMTCTEGGFVQAVVTKGRRSYNVRGIIDLLERLLGPDVLNHFSLSSNPPKDAAGRVDYVHKINSQLLTLLSKRGALLAHVTPDILLNYADYRIYRDGIRQRCQMRNNVTSDDQCLSEEYSNGAFECRSTQAWLDVILQLCKVVVLSRITAETMIDPSRWPDSNSDIALSDTAASGKPDDKDATLQGYSRSIVLPTLMRDPNQSFGQIQSGVYGPPERILLVWLSIHFRQQRRSLRAQDRIVANFDIDLSDGLVLAAITVAHAEYLREIFFDDLYATPETPEQTHHNASRVVDAWCTMCLGYSVKPGEITSPNAVHMLLLVSFLYQILPTYTPRDTIKFSTCLTGTTTQRILVTNPTSWPVCYSAVFFGNSKNYFNLERASSKIVIRPRESTNVNISFTARHIAKATAYVILCGATRAPNFSSNLTFVLEGDASDLAVSASFNLSTPLYVPTLLTLPIQPPYAGRAKYDLWVTDHQPTDSASFRATRWANLRSRKVPRRLFFDSEMLSVSDSEVQTPLSLTVCCMSPSVRSFWLAFRNVEVGDFLVRLTVSPQLDNSIGMVRVTMPRQQLGGLCSCSETDLLRGGTNNCPRRYYMPVPSRNAQLWDCVRKMFFKTLDEKEVGFWTKHLETDIGLRLVKWMLGGGIDSVADEFSHIFQRSVTYNVTCNSNMYVNVPTTFSIEDVISPNSATMPIHISPELPDRITVSMTLTSENKKEIRTYKVNFSIIDPEPVCMSVTAM